MLLLYPDDLQFRHFRNDRLIYRLIPSRPSLIVLYDFFFQRIVLSNLLHWEIGTVPVKYFKLFLRSFHKHIDLVGQIHFYLIQKSSLFEPCIFFIKKNPLIYFALFDDPASPADFSIPVQYLLFRPYMLSGLIIEHIPRGSLYDRLIKQPPFRKDQVDMEIRLSLVMVKGCHAGNIILFPESLHEKF